MSKRKKKRTTDQQQPPEQITNRTLDAFTNALARMGWGTPNIMEATAYPLTRLTKNYQLMNSLYRSPWVIRRIIDVVPEDMCKNWIQITSQLQPDQLSRLEKLQRKTSVKSKILEALKWGRLYGGAAAIIMIDGHENMLDKPLDLDTVFPGSFMGLLVVDRWSGLNPGPELVSDIRDPDFGLPSTYQVTNNADGTTITVHHSRLLRFIGRDLPNWEKQAEVYWGASEIEYVFDEPKKRDNTSWNLAHLVFRANLNVLHTDDLAQMLSTGNQQANQQLYNLVQAQNWLMNNFSMFMLDKDDKFETKQYTFSGLAEVYENFMYDVSGAAEIPVTKLFGRSPAGLNATGEGDLQNYYDSVETKQEAYLRPVLDKLLPVLFVSELGAVPDDMDYKFNQVRRPKDTEMADLAGKNTESVDKVFNSGIISQQIALKELRQQSDVTGLFTNITDEDIAAADTKANLPGEDIPADFGLFGGSENVGTTVGTE